MLGSGMIPRGKENDNARQAVNPFGDDPDEEEPHFDCTVRQKVHHETCWKRNKVRYIG